MKNQPERKQLGIKVSTSLWKDLKILAIKQGLTGGEALEQAMWEFIEKHNK
jgi:hypothetical protein